MAKLSFNNKKTFISSEPEVKNIYSRVLSDRELLKTRSRKYIDRVLSLDTESLTNVKDWEKFMNLVYEEFGTAEVQSIPVGIVSKCYLGQPYEVHILDLSGEEIIEHYKKNNKMPQIFEKVRTLALHNSYALIEVYTDKIIIIKEDGTAIKH